MHAPFQPRLQRRHLFVALFQRQVVDKEDEAEGEGCQKLLHLVDLPHLLFGQLRRAQPLRRVLVEHGVHRRRFARALVAVEQHVGIGQPAHEADDVVLHDALFLFVVFQVRKRHGGGVAHGHQLAAFKVKGPVVDEFAEAVLAEVRRQGVHRLGRRPVFAEGRARFSLADARKSLPHRRGDARGQLVRPLRQSLQYFQIVREGSAKVGSRLARVGGAGKQVVVAADLLRQVSGKILLHARLQQGGKGAGVALQLVLLRRLDKGAHGGIFGDLPKQDERRLLCIEHSTSPNDF